jgi:cell division protein FtsI (penicillin-binding protein 3)
MFFYGVISLAFALIGVRLYFLQNSHHPQLAKMAANQHKKTVVRLPNRGNIYDRRGEKLATSIDVTSIAINPRARRISASESKTLAQVLDLPASVIQKKAKSKKYFEWMKRYATPEQVAKVKSMNLAGAIFIGEKKRYYPYRELAANAMGFIGHDQVGLSGLELRYEPELAGERISLKIDRDARGQLIHHDVSTGFDNLNGKSLVLTIDKQVQYMVEMELEKAILENGAKGGAAIAMDPKTGEILAMASLPNFNPNVFWRYPAQNYSNRNVTELIEPGSIMKAVVLAAALSDSAVDLNTIIDCEQGQYLVGNKVIHDVVKKGRIPVKDVLKYSSNVGFVKIAEKLGKDRLHSWFRHFGFGQKTGVEVAGEAAGIVKKTKRMTEIDFATQAFGQGISVTLLQLLNSLNVIANGGRLMRPTLVKEILDAKEEPIWKSEPRVMEIVLSRQVAEKARQALSAVVNEEGGGGHLAKLTGYHVAGKTSTAQKISEQKYSDELHMALFAGMLPTEDPKLTMIVMIDEPKGEQFGGRVAAPIFKNIAHKVVAYLGIRPQEVITPEIMIAQKEKYSGQPASADGGGDGRAPEKITGPIEQNSPALVQNFIGMGIRDVLYALKTSSHPYQLRGQGVAYKQIPAPGSPVSGKRPIQIYFQSGIQ